MFLTLSNLTGLSLHELAPPQSDSEDADTPKQEDSIDTGEGSSGEKDSDEERNADILSTPKKKQKLSSESAKITNESDSKGKLKHKQVLMIRFVR
jgi:hypothetical protein